MVPPGIPAAPHASRDIEPRQSTPYDSSHAASS